MRPVEALFLFLLLVIGGLILEGLAKGAILSGHKKEIQRTAFFPLADTSIFFFLPAVSLIVLVAHVGMSLLYVFVVFALAGTAFEWLIGFFYHQIIGQRLWTYHRYTISGYTSFLSVPFWGLAGVFFWLLSQVFVK